MIASCHCNKSPSNDKVRGLTGIRSESRLKDQGDSDQHYFMKSTKAVYVTKTVILYQVGLFYNCEQEHPLEELEHVVKIPSTCIG